VVILLSVLTVCCVCHPF